MPFGRVTVSWQMCMWKLVASPAAGCRVPALGAAAVGESARGLYYAGVPCDLVGQPPNVGRNTKENKCRPVVYYHHEEQMEQAENSQGEASPSLLRVPFPISIISLEA